MVEPSALDDTQTSRFHNLHVAATSSDRSDGDTEHEIDERFADDGGATLSGFNSRSSGCVGALVLSAKMSRDLTCVSY